MNKSSQIKALVCGGSRGIGKEVVLALLKNGVEVTALARSEKDLEKLGANYHVVDFQDAASVQRALDTLPSDFHILVCNSGGPASGPLSEANIEDFENAFQAHLFTSHSLMKKVLPFMKKEKFGRIITVLSSSVKAPLPNLGVSNTLRAAMAAWAKTLATELGPYGITVNNVLPGATKTERLDSLAKKAADKRGVSTSDIENEWLDAIPAGRFASPSETAQAIAFLASEQAAYINGINLPVDGGRLGCL